MAKGGGIDGVAVGAVAVGGLFMYSGITGRGVLASLQAAIQGKNPNTISQSSPINVSAAAQLAAVAGQIATGITVSASSSALGTSIANDALVYKGAGYVFGGAPAKGRGNWDCSSFVNWVIGHDLMQAIPGYDAGKYAGTSHGPTALMWSLWTGCTTIGTKGAQAQPGDLCCWQTHIGIAIGGGQMISARSAKDNPPTGINTIDGDIKGEILTIRRLKAAA